MSDCKPVQTLLKLVWSLCCIWLRVLDQIPISFAINALSRFNNNPSSEHWPAVKRIFRYLQGAKDLNLVYTGKGNDEIVGYCDADWASNCATESQAQVTFLCCRVVLFPGDHTNNKRPPYRQPRRSTWRCHPWRGRRYGCFTASLVTSRRTRLSFFVIIRVQLNSMTAIFLDLSI